MSNDYNDRVFIIFEVSELTKINFDDVLETSIETTRKSVDGTKTFVKWEGNTPSCINNLTTKEGPYTYNEFLQILDTNEWSDRTSIL